MRGPYCYKCGQHAVDYRRSFGRVFLDVLDSFLNWDSKFFATVGLLLTRPWQLTNSFLAGKRVRYVHPLRLYLLASVAFFFGVHQLAQQAKLNHGSSRALTAEEKATVNAALEKLPPTEREEARARIEKSTRENRSGALRVEADEEDFKEKPTDSSFERWINHQLKIKIGTQGMNAKAFFMALVSNLPAMMLCCIPLFAFVLKLLYLFRRRYYIDHLIYALHIHAFAYLAILIIGYGAVGLSQILPHIWGLPFAFLIVAAVLLLLLSIRKVYRQNWFLTIFKFCFGGAIYLLVISIALGATFFITLALPD